MGFPIVGEFLANLKQKFRNRDDKLVKVAELKKVKSESKTIEKFVQKFRRVVRGNKFEERLLIEKFKRGMDRVVQRRLMEAESLLRSIKQWYEKATNFNKY